MSFLTTGDYNLYPLMWNDICIGYVSGILSARRVARMYLPANALSMLDDVIPSQGTDGFYYNLYSGSREFYMMAK